MWRLRVLEFVPCFLSGVLAYWLLRREKRALINAHLWIPIIVVDIAIGYLAWDAWPNSWMVRTFYCAVLGVTIPLVSELRTSPLTRTAHTVALYSYGIYLLHPIALWIGFNVLRDQPLIVQCAVVIAALTIGCVAAYAIVEKPGIKLGRSIAHRRRPLVAEPAAP